MFTDEIIYKPTKKKPEIIEISPLPEHERGKLKDKIGPPL